jgi:hypothetical protein
MRLSSSTNKYSFDIQKFKEHKIHCSHSLGRTLSIANRKFVKALYFKILVLGYVKQIG